NRFSLRQQNIDLAQLRDDLFGFVLLLGHSNVLLRLNSLLQGGPLFRGQTSKLGAPSEIDVLMPGAKGGAVTNSFVWVHDLESKSGYATVRAELWTVGAGARLVANPYNTARVDFTGTTPPPPPPPPPAPTLPKLRVTCSHYWADQPSYGTYTCFIDIEVVN